MRSSLTVRAMEKLLLHINFLKITKAIYYLSVIETNNEYGITK